MSSQYCQVDSSSSYLPLNSSLWWPFTSEQPKLFAVNPTMCDRDYEHLSGPSNIRMKGCSPKSTVLDNQVTNAYSAQYQLEYAGLFRNYDGKQTRMASMPFYNLTRTGFLGVAPVNLSSGGSTTYVVNCEQHQNCYAYSFTVNGAIQQQRVYRKSIGGALHNYDNSDVFRCGVFAFFDPASSKCMLDFQVVPLYVALCKTQSVQQMCTCSSAPADELGCTPTVDAAQLASVCFQIKESYSPSYSTTQSNNRNLQALFDLFLESDGGLTAHVSGLECFNAIYNSMQLAQAYGSAPVAGVYYPFNFALYEIPLAWVYQCVYIGGFKINPSNPRMSCQQFEEAVSVTDAARFPAPAFNFDVVQGGYRRADVQQSASNFTDHILSAVPSLTSIQESRRICQDTFKLGSCDMVPYCANSRNWLPNSGMTMNTRYFLAGHYQDSCGAGAGHARHHDADGRHPLPLERDHAGREPDPDGPAFSEGHRRRRHHDRDREYGRFDRRHHHA